MDSKELILLAKNSQRPRSLRVDEVRQVAMALAVALVALEIILESLSQCQRRFFPRLGLLPVGLVRYPLVGFFAGLTLFDTLLLGDRLLVSHFLRLALLFVCKIFARFELQVDLTGLLSRWKGRVGLFGAHLVGLLALDIPFLELGQEARPILILKIRILREFLLDHEAFQVVHGMDVGHTIEDDSACLFEALPRIPHNRDRVALHQDVASRQ